MSEYRIGFDTGADDESVLCIFDQDGRQLLACEEVGWLVDLVRLANEYREVPRMRANSKAIQDARNALLRHAYNGGKAP